MIRSFSGTQSYQASGDVIVSTLGLVGASVLAYLVWKKVRGSSAHLPAGVRSLPRDIAEILDQALHSRSRMDICFHPVATNRQTIACTLSDLSTGVTLELPHGVNPSESWLGRDMACYFRVPQENKPPYFYRFVSSVASMHEHGGYKYLQLHTPARVELGQKRRHMRLEVPPTDIKAFRLWSATETSTFHFETDQDKWPEPLAEYSAEDGGVRILDISGGGIRLAFDPEQYQGIDDFVSRHPILFMYLELAPVAGLTFPPYYVAARLRTKLHDYDSGAFMLGYEFVECSPDQSVETLDWVKIEPEKGIDNLVTWIFKRHLELYREREII